VAGDFFAEGVLVRSVGRMEIQHLICRLAGCGLVVAGLLTGSGVAASAQSAIGQTPTDLPGVSVVPPPPTGYNPLAGTHAQFPLPPAPDVRAAPEAYAAWQRAVTAAQNRETPVLTPTKIFNGPVRAK
jgi:hypothetical protein